MICVVRVMLCRPFVSRCGYIVVAWRVVSRWLCPVTDNSEVRPTCTTPVYCYATRVVRYATVLLHNPTCLPRARTALPHRRLLMFSGWLTNSKRRPWLATNYTDRHLTTNTPASLTTCGYHPGVGGSGWAGRIRGGGGVLAS